jgi:hypothetical protein
MGVGAAVRFVLESIRGSANIPRHGLINGHEACTYYWNSWRTASLSQVCSSTQLLPFTIAISRSLRSSHSRRTCGRYWIPRIITWGSDGWRSRSGIPAIVLSICAVVEP